MTTAQISSFDDVILFELQKKMYDGVYPMLTFGEIWSASAAASSNFFAPVDAVTNRRVFTARIFDALQILSKIEYVAVNTDGENKVESVRLTEAGKTHVSKIIFSNQQRMARV